MKLIRKKMMEIMAAETQKSTLKDLTKKFVQESIGKQILKECGKIFPLQNVIIRKVKMLKKPKFDLTKLMENYQERPEAEAKGKKGKKGEEDKKEEPRNLLDGGKRAK